MHSVYNIKVLLEHVNSRTFKGLEFFFQNSRTSQGPYEPCYKNVKSARQSQGHYIRWTAIEMADIHHGIL